MRSAGTRVAMVSMHTSPAAPAGSRDSGGMNVLLLELARELACHGVEVDLITRAEGVPSTTILSPGVTLHELAAGGPGPIRKEALPSVSDEFGEAVARLGRTGPGFDVVHAHYWISGIATLPVALELGIPFVQSFHTVGAMKNRTLAAAQAAEPELRLRSEGFLAMQANAIIAGSAAEATSLIDDVRAPADRIWVIPPGVDIGLFTRARAATADAAVRAEYGIASGTPVITVAGRVQPLKDQALAIHTLAELHLAGEWTPTLVIAGECTPGDDGYLEELAELAHNLGMGSRVRFAGALSRERLADLFAVSSVTLLPSHSETFSLVALESAASGTPVVGFRGTGLLESVADGVSGVLVDSRDPLDWAVATSALLRGDREAAASAARRHAEGYTWAATAAATLAVYGSLAVPAV
ncbi:MAG: glycosyltransferase [Burkholderiaceae bacterium]|nr:glycosyltransferase [Microbacteriaceae bacterium]